MGIVLENTAHSVNIKERLDFSCALFDAAGQLIANAPHIPVHLGSMGDSVQAVLREYAGQIRPGDVFMLNSPYAGGSHLPDITVITPVYDASDTTIEFLVACRAHHADIGGQTPGSMPPFSRNIDQEGVVIEGFRLVAAGELQLAELQARLRAGPYPARNIEQNVADLRAQIAANAKGVALLGDMVAHFGANTVKAYMKHVQDNAAEAVRQVIQRIAEGHFEYAMDGDLKIVVRISIDPSQRQATIDFTGTSKQSTGNFNAPVSVTRAAVLYVFRSLVASEIPLNAGCLQPLTLVIPPGSLLNPRPPAAVVAGNVETSQCITNALFAALGIMAASQGTMNNLTCGDEQLQYYETICGGAGAGADFDGADAVHTHMTNSRITDPEVLEQRLPVLLREFSIRRGSGGGGRHRGGDGARRSLQFQRPMRAAILSNHRQTAPVGLFGGADGLCGNNILHRADGHRELLAATAEIEIEAGDTLTIETPGGGGFGKPVAQKSDESKN
jgi:5-oxoprolinase (ATP-hydrolysing)